MINLLPPDYKSQITFARMNTTLKNWAIASLIGVLGVVAVIAAGHLFMSQSTKSWQKQVNDTQEQLKTQKLEETQKRVTEISDSVKLAGQVLSKQVLFSKLLTQVGAAMPNGTSLQSLSINAPAGGIDLSAVATSYQSATQVQINLSDPANKIFEKADIVSATCQDNSETKVEYPCQVTIRALFAKDNVFQYSAGAKVGN